jgi:beta-phosphoglucomutase
MSIPWIHQFTLFLFDFDGLLVNTEHLHFEAYRKMCKNRGIELSWDFDRFCLAAHFISTGVKDALYKEYPELYAMEPNWDVLYAEKKKFYQELLEEGKLQLMPGAGKLLKALEENNIRRCVVTHSPKIQIDAIKKSLPALSSIPTWFTREDYQNPKPAPDGYLKAISTLAKNDDRIIGFEDSIRGLRSLQGTIAKPVLICQSTHPQLKTEKIDNVPHFESLDKIPGNGPS